MPLVDFNVNPDFDLSRFDCVIVGAGAAGLYLADRLHAHHRVLVLESGHFLIDEEKQRLNEVTKTGKDLTAAVWGRKRAIGGTTTIWGGQSLPFSEIDFEPRPWVKAGSWPIQFSDLRVHYDKVNNTLGVDTQGYFDEALKALSITKPPFDESKVVYHLSKWLPQPNFRKIFRKQISQSFTLLYNCQLLRIRTIEHSVVGLEVCNFTGHHAYIPTSSVVIAAGALESNRILLNLDKEARLLSEEQRTLLGKGFMEHPCIYVGSLEVDDPFTFQRLFNPQIRNGRRYSIRLSASPAWQRTNELLNVSAGIQMLFPEDVFNPYAALKELWRSRSIKTVTLLLQHSGALVKTLCTLISHRFILKVGAQPRVGFMSEQESLLESCTSLSNELDQFGIPKLHVNWAISELTWKTVVAFSKVLQEEFGRLGIGQLKLEQFIHEDEANWRDHLSDVNHHMGGIRMGADAASSIVNEYLEVHACSGLYICSAAVFPTSSHSNPTLTLLALVDRFADHFLSASGKS